MRNTKIFDADLNPVLEVADNGDLGLLIDVISNKLSEELTTNDVYKANQPNHTVYADLIAKEIRDFGGNTFANIWRGGEGPAYREIVQDVADKLKVNYTKGNAVAEIEDRIFEKILEKTLEQMTEEEKYNLAIELGLDKGKMSSGGMVSTSILYAFRAGGFGSYQLTLIIANQIAKLLIGRGLVLATNAALVRFASILTGPIGLALTGIWTMIDLAGPSYKTTIPSVILVATIRKKINSLRCSNDACGNIITDRSAKFCACCGTKVA